jgi:hypothetical protein
MSIGTNQIAGILAFFIGVAAVAYFLWTVLRQLAVSQWPKVHGVVVESYVKNTKSSCEPFVRFEYTVDDQTYCNDRFRPLSYQYDVQNIRQVEKMIAPFPVGSDVLVYFDPANPGDGVLQRRDAVVTVFWLVFAGIFLAAGWGLMTGDSTKSKEPTISTHSLDPACGTQAARSC